MKNKKQSTRRGATIERSVVIQKIRRIKNDYSYGSATVDTAVINVMNQLEAWIYKRVPRFKAKKGGL